MSILTSKKKQMYDPFRKTIPPLRRREDSKAVMELLEYLGKNEEHNIFLVEIEGDPALSCEPGIKKGEDERFAVLYRAESLLIAAVPDLRELMRNGHMRLRFKR